MNAYNLLKTGFIIKMDVNNDIIITHPDYPNFLVDAIDNIDWDRLEEALYFNINIIIPKEGNK